MSGDQCRLMARRRAEMGARLEDAIQPSEDHVLILDLGPAERVGPLVESMGKSYTAPPRQATVV